jgi:hypothetical protein
MRKEYGVSSSIENTFEETKLRDVVERAVKHLWTYNRVEASRTTIALNCDYCATSCQAFSKPLMAF